MIRKALIGERVLLPSGNTGKVTGINTNEIARVATGNGAFEDVPQDQLVHLPVNKS